MLMQYLPPEERKGESRYRHGDRVLYDDRPNEEQQRQMLEYAESHREWGYVITPCVVCGRPILSMSSEAATRMRYCSQRCRNDAYMERRRQRHEAQLRKVCSVCGEPFTAKRTNAMYCSTACKQSAYRSRVTDNRFAKFGKTDSGNVTSIRLGKFTRTDSGNA